MTRVGMAAQSALSLAAVVALPFFGAAGASIDIASSEIERADDYARISTNTSMVVFYLGNVVAPTPREECRIGDRTVTWSVSPETQGGHLSSESEMFVVYFSNQSDFGKSYVVNATATWRVYDESNGNVVDVIRETDLFQLDAIRYDFVVSCSSGVHPLNHAYMLVDNQPAEARVRTYGCTRTNLLQLSMAALPEEQNPVNKAGTAMPFSRTQNPCVLHTPKTYWYGLSDPNDCFFKEYKYIFTLYSDFDPVCQNTEAVGWPEEEPALTYEVDISPDFVYVATLFADGRIRVVATNCKYVITKSTANSICQYKDEIEAEELFHYRQITGQVGIDLGGCEDLFDMRRAMTNDLGFLRTGVDCYERIIPFSEYGYCYVNPEDYVNTIIENVARKQNEEISESMGIINVDENRGYIEKCAKESAGYNAAFKYHCTYGNPASGCRFLGYENDLRPRRRRQ